MEDIQLALSGLLTTHTLLLAIQSPSETVRADSMTVTDYWLRLQ